LIGGTLCFVLKELLIVLVKNNILARKQTLRENTAGYNLPDFYLSSVICHLPIPSHQHMTLFSAHQPATSTKLCCRSFECRKNKKWCKNDCSFVLPQMFSGHRIKKLSDVVVNRFSFVLNLLTSV
jgi:hypothetical protein